MDDILLSSQTEALAAYSDRHELYDLFQGMLEHCIMTRPDDVVTFFLDYLKVPTSKKTKRTPSTPSPTLRKLSTHYDFISAIICYHWTSWIFDQECGTENYKRSSVHRDLLSNLTHPSFHILYFKGIKNSENVQCR